MNPEQSNQNQGSKTKSIAFYLTLAVSVLAPLSFWGSMYVSSDVMKSLIIVVGILAAAFCLVLTALKERKLELPPKQINWTIGLVAVSTVISSLLSANVAKSFFGQGFEVGTASFILTMIIAMLVAYTIAKDKPERTVITYVGMIAVFLILVIFHGLRFIVGPEFMTLGVLGSLVSTVFGNWSALGIFSMLIAIISLSAVIYLPLSRKMKIVYWALVIVSTFGAIVVSNVFAWKAAVLVFLGMAVLGWRSSTKRGGNVFSSFIKRIAWIPTVALILSVLFVWQGSVVAIPIVDSLNAGYQEPILPWQLTLDVGSGAVKDNPVFGVGPNRFAQAYYVYKPLIVNQSDQWAAEFVSGSGTIPTFFVTQGFVGLVSWILFFVFFGILGVRALKRLPENPQVKYIVVSSFAGASFMWISGIMYVHSHVNLLFTFILSGLWIGSAVSYGLLEGVTMRPALEGKKSKLFAGSMIVVMVLVAVWGLVQVKKTVAIAFFSSGVKHLTAGDPDSADAKFKTANSLDKSDAYMQARAEAGITKISKLASTVNANTNASTSEQVLKQISDVLASSVKFTDQAIEYDKNNYYNYISAARVYEMATNLRVQGAYEKAVESYVSAINLFPRNPSIYLSLARLQASQNKLDDSLQSLGAALQFKNNYLDAVFLFSQVSAAKGNLVDAITAAKFATQLNPNSPILHFQLGMLNYNAKKFADAASAFEAAIKVQPDYANAKYFLGLSYSSIGKNQEAIEIFAKLAQENPDNQEIALILNNLQAGKSAFANAAPVTTSPEKRSSLPLKESTKNKR